MLFVVVHREPLGAATCVRMFLRQFTVGRPNPVSVAVIAPTPHLLLRWNSAVFVTSGHQRHCRRGRLLIGRLWVLTSPNSKFGDLIANRRPHVLNSTKHSGGPNCVIMVRR